MFREKQWKNRKKEEKKNSKILATRTYLKLIFISFFSIFLWTFPKGTSWNVGLLWIPGSLNFTGTAILRKHWKHVCSAHCTAPNLASESQANAFLGPYMQLSYVNPNFNTSSGDQSCKCQPSHKTSSGFVLRPASHTWKGLVTAGLSKSKSHFKSPECLVISPSVC